VRRLQSLAAVVAVVCGVLGLMTSTGCPVLPEGDPSAVAPLHLAMLLIGALAGVCTLLRTREVDRERWRAVEDSALTSGEREWAHKEADQSKKSAGIAFLMAPLTLGFWMAYHFGVEGQVTAASFLTLTPLVGFGLGLGAAALWQQRSGGAIRGPDD
jgi:peptidoglycan/LPS O-acetylase OafA/YrhL